MTFIPSVLTNDDPNNSYVGSGSSIPNIFTGTPTITTGYNTIILSIQSTISSTSGGIQIFMQDNIETPIMFYSDTYNPNTLYIKNFTITKKKYYIVLTLANSPGSSDTLNMISRLSTELDSSITYNDSSTFNFSEEFALDAFGKLRVTNPVTLLDIKFPGQSNGTTDYLKNTLIVCSAASSPSYSSTSSNSKLIITGIGSGYYISQSRKFCTYQPGKSLLFMASGIICPCDGTFTNAVSGYTGRIGYYSNNFTPTTIPNLNLTTPYNGLYFEYNSTTSIMSINVVNNGSLTSYPQSQWNLDQMNGIGPSRLNLDFKKTQLFVLDMEWLGVGRIRFGFYAYGKIQYCHQIINLNILTSPYTGNINLPIRYELIGDGTNISTSANILQICSTVISEGGYNPIGKPFSIGSGLTPTALNTQNLEVPILILRPSMNTSSTSNNNNYHTNIIPNQISMINNSNSNLTLLTVRLYQAENTGNIGTISNWYEINSNTGSNTPYISAAQYAPSSSITTGTNFTNGSIVLDYKYFYGSLSSSVNNLGGIFNDQVLHLTSNIQGQSDYLVITATNLSNNNSSVYVTLNWTEL